MPKSKLTSKQTAAAKAALLNDPDVDVTPVRIVDDRRFTGKFQVIEDEGERRVLGWGFGSADAAQRWIQVQNKLSSWLRLAVRQG